jgi:hypothetical protein
MSTATKTDAVDWLQARFKEHRIWTNKDLRDAARLNGIETVDVVRAMDWLPINPLSFRDTTNGGLNTIWIWESPS